MKNRMLKTLCVLLSCAVMALAAAGCGSDASDTVQEETAASEDAETAKDDADSEAEKEETEEEEKDSKAEEDAADAKDDGTSSEDADSDAFDASKSDGTTGKAGTAASGANGAADAGGTSNAGADASGNGTESEDLSAQPLSAGMFSLDGEIYRLGSTYNEIRNGSWSLNPEDEERYSGYVLNPRTTSGSGMTMYSDTYGRSAGDFSVVISTENRTENTVAMFDAPIDYYDMPRISRAETRPDIVLPGGLTAVSTQEEFIAAYGEPTYRHEDDSSDAVTLRFEDEGISLTVSWQNGTIRGVTLAN